MTMGLDIRYLAGFIDGEGSIGARWVRPSKASKTHLPFVFVPYLQIGHTDAVILRDIRQRWGGTVVLARPSTMKWKAGYFWRVSSRKVEIPLRELVPFLRLKKQQAELVLEALDILSERQIHRPRRGYKFYSVPYPIRMQEIWETLRCLNKRGPVDRETKLCAF